MDEAHRSGVIVLPELTEFQTKLTTSNWRNPEVSYTATCNSLAGARTAGERADSVLRLLCEARSARSGHLYLYQENCLELVASRGQGTPDAELRELVVRYVARQLRSDDCATVIESETIARFSSESWLDQYGASHQFMLLMSQRGTARLCAGVAAIESSGQSVIDPSARRLLTELTEELLRLGDASGITEAGA
jgi:hypothetical protein